MRVLLFGLGIAMGVVILLSQESQAAGEKEGATGRVTYTVQGDSLQVHSEPYLRQTRPDWQLVSFSAKGGRRAPQELNILRRQKLGRVVMVSAGTNDWLKSVKQFEAALDKIIRLVGPGRCLVMATVYDHGAVEPINRILKDHAAKAGAGRMQLADWAEQVEAGAVRLADQVHPGTRRDHRRRAEMLIEAAERCLGTGNEN